MSKKWRWAAGALGAVALGEAALIHLGRTYGSTEEERSKALPGDDIVSDPKVATDHAITIGACSVRTELRDPGHLLGRAFRLSASVLSR